MEHVKFIEIKKGVDVGYHNSNIEPINREGCVGKSGIDKTYTIEMVLELTHKISDKPNIIIKSGPNAKWYMKRVEKDAIDEKVQKQKWRDTSRNLMYIIDWNN